MKARATLLVVDDAEMNRDMLSRRLRREGYTVLVASSGREALEIIDRQQVTLILLDIEMPEMSGLDVLANVRGRYSRSELPIIMVTARQQSSDIVDALTLGASDYVTKPIDFPVAIARIETQLWLKQARRGAPRERGALCARRSGSKRRPLGLESQGRRAVCVAALETDARARGAREHQHAGRLARSHPSGRRRARALGDCRPPGRRHTAVRDRASDPAQRRELPLGAEPRNRGTRQGRRSHIAWPGRKRTSPKTRCPMR